MKDANRRVRIPGNRWAEAADIYRQACAFAECADRCTSDNKQDVVREILYGNVQIVNSAFACELFLKALIYYFEEAEPKEHHLRVLLDRLPDDSKQRIMHKAGRYYMTFSPDILLYQVDNAFTDWRYVFEKRSLTMDGLFLTEFRNALREECESVLKTQM